MGVSATHLDWTMVPYVRKSFTKHLKDAFKYVGRGDGISEAIIKQGEVEIDNKIIKINYPKCYNYAFDMTEKEVYQAVEAMYHNLNTLQSRSGE